MDSQFEKVTYDIINKFLEQLSDRCIIPHDKLWGIWKDMFNFPAKKEKRVYKKVKTPPKQDEKQDVHKEDKPEVKQEEEMKQEKPEANQEEKPVEDNQEEEKQEVMKPVEKVKEKVKDKKENKEKSPGKESETCVFIITRGERSGKECGKPISKKMKSDKFCVAHSK